MKIGAWVIVISVTAAIGGGCGNTGDDYMVNPGHGSGPNGSGSGSGHMPDAGGVDPDAAYTAKVCMLTDPRNPMSCATTGVDGLTVTLGTQTATTAADGAFTMMTPNGSGLVWRVKGATVVTAVVPFSASHDVPAISVDRYTQLLGDNGQIFIDQEASIIARVTQRNAAASGATTTVTPPPAAQVFYDGSSAVMWDENTTSTYGTIWVPVMALQSGTSATLTITSADTGSGSTITAFPSIPLENQAITFVTLDLP